MNLKLSSLLALTLMSIGLSAHAECTYPKAPANTPDGKTATQAELVAAIQDMKRYNTEITAYAACVDQEADAQIAAGGTVISADEIKKIKADSAEKHNAGVDDLQKRADALNAQIKLYKTLHPAKG